MFYRVRSDSIDHKEKVNISSLEGKADGTELKYTEHHRLKTCTERDDEPRDESC